MALLIKSEVKNILGIASTDTSKDTYIDALIPHVIELACQTIKSRFPGSVSNSNEFSFDSATKTITDSDSGFSEFESGMGIYISGSKLNDGFKTVVTAADGSLIVSDTVYTEAEDDVITITDVKMPSALKLTLSKIIAHFLQKDKVGLTSFSVGSLSWYYANAGAVPNELIAELYKSAGKSSVWGV